METSASCLVIMKQDSTEYADVRTAEKVVSGLFVCLKAHKKQKNIQYRIWYICVFRLARFEVDKKAAVLRYFCLLQYKRGSCI